MKHSCHKKKARPGFSLIEIMLTLFIFVTIGGGAWAFQKNIFSLNSIISETLVSQDEARRVLKLLSAEIRSAAPSSVGAYPIGQATTSSLIVYADIDDDQLMERVRYFMNGSTLRKGVLKPTGNPLVYVGANEVVQDVVHNIVNSTSTPIFEYFDSAYNGTTSTPPLVQPVNVPDIRLIRMMVEIDENGAEIPGPVTVTTQATLRNIKDNL